MDLSANSASAPQFPDRFPARLWLQQVPADWDRIADQRRLVYTNPPESPTPFLTCTHVGGRYFEFRYDDDARFVFDTDGQNVWVTWPKNLSSDDVALYLFGPMLGIAYRLQGIISLHASAVQVDDLAVLLAGKEFAGKSTTAADFAVHGHAILADDVSPVISSTQGFDVALSHARIRLWPEAAEALLGAAHGLREVAPTLKKYYLEGRMPERCDSLPLGCIYLLERSETPGVTVDPVPFRDAVVALVSNSFPTRFLNERMRKDEFEFFSRVVRAVPVRRIRSGNDLASMRGRRGAILVDVRSFANTAKESLPGARAAATRQK